MDKIENLTRTRGRMHMAVWDGKIHKYLNRNNESCQSNRLSQAGTRRQQPALLQVNISSQNKQTSL
jgi:hypothetical protein